MVVHLHFFDGVPVHVEAAMLPVSWADLVREVQERTSAPTPTCAHALEKTGRDVEKAAALILRVGLASSSA